MTGKLFSDPLPPKARLTAGVIVAALLFLLFPLGSAVTQSEVTATPDGETAATIEVRLPTLEPPFVPGAEPGWIKITGKSAYTIYAVSNAAAGDTEDVLGADNRLFIHLRYAAAGDSEEIFGGSWRTAIPEAGYYRVEAYIGAGEVLAYKENRPDIPPLTRSARYLVHHAGGATPVEVDQNRRGSEWVDLGVFFFEGGTGALVELDNRTGEEAGQALVTFSALRFRAAETPTPTGTPTATTAVPTATHTPTPTATVGPTATPTTPAIPDEVDALEWGEPSLSSGPDGTLQAQVPLFIDGRLVGTVDYTYPEEMAPRSAGQIEVAITVAEAFTSTVDFLVRDLTRGVEIGPRTLAGRFSLSLDAQTFEFSRDFVTQSIDVSAGRTTAASWNIEAEPGVVGDQDVNIKLVLGFSERGIPRITGKPLAFKIRVLAPPTTPTVTATPVATPAGEDGSLFGSPLVPVLCGAGLLLALLAGALFYLDRRRKGSAGGAAGAAAQLEGEEQVRLYQMLRDHFDEQGLRELCFLMNIDYDDLPFSGKSNKARELVALCVDTGRLEELADQIREQRPRLFADQPEDRGLEAGETADND